jgi:hypothetical protein
MVESTALGVCRLVDPLTDIIQVKNQSKSIRCFIQFTNSRGKSRIGA